MLSPTAPDFPGLEARQVIDREEWLIALSGSLPTLIWCSGSDGLCTYFNQRWLDFTGRTMEESVGDGWARDLHPDDLDRVVQSYYHSLQDRQKFRLEYRLRYRGGPYKWIVDFGTPVFDAKQMLLGYIGGCLDVTTIKGTSCATSWREKYEAALTADMDELSSRIWAAEVAIRDRMEDAIGDPREKESLDNSLQTLIDMKREKLGME